MGDLVQGLIVMTSGGFFVGTAGLGLALLWSRSIRGSWPDRDKAIFLAKLFYGIGASGIVMYLLIKYA